MFVCRACFMATRSRPRLTFLSRLSCSPMDALCAKRLHHAMQLNHQVVAFCTVYDPTCLRPLFVCRSCGAYGQRQFRSLYKVCVGGHAHASNWRSIFVRGRHPRTGAKLFPGQRIQLPQVWRTEEFDVGVLFGARAPQNAPNANSNPSRNCGFDDPEGVALSESD